MSEVTSRPRVRTVTAADGSSLAAAAGVILAAAAAAALSRAAREAVRACSDSLAVAGPLSSVDSPARARSARAGASGRVKTLVAAAALPALEAAKVQAVTMPLAAALAVNDAGAVRAAVEKVAAATDLASVETAGAELDEVLDRQHAAVFERALAGACAEASVAAGFSQIETSRRGDLHRVVALDGSGHALVSEIRVDAAGVPAIATEALGWSDRACQATLDRFDREFAGRVRSDAPVRSSTHGVAQLASARDLELANQETDRTVRDAHRAGRRRRAAVSVRSDRS